jgi:N-methylhydantoinase B/oxoprolinase/acetone carboxylase alpha subunit
MRTDKHAVEPFGSDGGLPGGKGACVVNPAANSETRLPSRFGDQRLQKNDLVRVERPGGGGLGNPLKRPPAQVLDDVRQGYVSLAAARERYGVAIEMGDGQPALNEGETAILRGKN